MTRNQTKRWLSRSGFTMPEVLVAIFLTLMVMATVFGLLAQGARSSTVEMERADLQAQTRHALDQISRDVVLAGYGLPPEFPALGPGSSLRRFGDGPKGIEVLGNMTDDLGGGPVLVESFDGRTARLGETAVRLAPGQPVLIYDDLPTEGSWILGLVEEVRATPSMEVDVVTAPGASVSYEGTVVRLPEDVAHYDRIPNGPPSSGFMTSLSVVDYELQPPRDGSVPLLVRRLNWGEPIPVAQVEDMEIRYFVGATITGPVIQSTPNRELAPYQRGGPSSSGSRQTRPSPPETELDAPPVPQPDPSLPLDENQIVRAVRVSLTGRSRRANLVGSRLSSKASGAEAGFLRQTFSTRVATRNLVSQAELRRIQLQSDRARR